MTEEIQLVMVYHAHDEGVDRALSATGRRQASAVAAQLATEAPFSLVLCSPLPRAQQTLDALRSTLGDAPLREDERLREVAAWSWNETVRMSPERRVAVLEQLDAVHHLVWDTVLPTGGRILLVTHANLIRYLVRLVRVPRPGDTVEFRVGQVVDGDSQPAELSPGSITRATLDSDGHLNPRTWNETAHLPAFAE